MWQWRAEKQTLKYTEGNYLKTAVGDYQLEPGVLVTLAQLKTEHDQNQPEVRNSHKFCGFMFNWWFVFHLITFFRYKLFL